jgi:hypothetical protein
MQEYLSTQQVADEIGVAKRTLLRWLYAAHIPEVKRHVLGGIEVRLWSKSDLARARRFKATNYGKRSAGSKGA